MDLYGMLQNSFTFFFYLTFTTDTMCSELLDRQINNEATLFETPTLLNVI
jgi:hypothetical protein